MRILIYSINFAPEKIGVGKYTGEMAAWLADRGDDVRVVTAPPYYPEWRVGVAYRAWWYLRELKGSRLRVVRCPLWVPARPSGVSRIIHLFSFALSSIVPVLAQVFWRPQRVVVIEPPLFCAPAGWLLSMLSGARSLLHVQDFEVDAAFELGLLRFGFMRAAVLRFERSVMQRYSCVTTISPKMVSRLLAKGVAERRAGLFPNWVCTKAIFPLSRASGFRARWDIREDQVVYLYSGNMGSKQGLELLIECANRLRDRGDFVFVLCGDGVMYRRLRELARGVPNIRWYPLQPEEELNELLNLADVHLLPQRAGAADLVMPSKLAGMLASGRPVIATASEGTEIAEIVTGCGLLCPPGDLSRFVEQVVLLGGDVALRSELGRRAREKAEVHFDKEIVLDRFRKMLENI